MSVRGSSCPSRYRSWFHACSHLQGITRSLVVGNKAEQTRAMIERGAPIDLATLYSSSCIPAFKSLTSLFVSILWPLLMQSDLRSVGIGAIGAFARAFAPKMCETAVSRFRMTWTFLQDLSRAVSRFSRCLFAGNHLRCFSIQLGQIRLQSPIGMKKTYFPIRSLIVIVFNPVGSEKYRRLFLATGHLKKRETALDRSWRRVQIVLRRETAVSFAPFRGKSSCERADSSTISN